MGRFLHSAFYINATSTPPQKNCNRRHERAPAGSRVHDLGRGGAAPWFPHPQYPKRKRTVIVDPQNH